jgi:hypothetical protein
MINIFFLFTWYPFLLLLRNYGKNKNQFLLQGSEPETEPRARIQFRWLRFRNTGFRHHLHNQILDYHYYTSAVVVTIFSMKELPKIIICLKSWRKSLISTNMNNTTVIIRTRRRSICSCFAWWRGPDPLPAALFQPAPAPVTHRVSSGIPFRENASK